MFTILPGRLAMVVIVGLLALTAAPATAAMAAPGAMAPGAAAPGAAAPGAAAGWRTAAALPSGSYDGPLELYGGTRPGGLVLDRIDVAENQIVVHLRLVNTLPTKLQMTCPAAGPDQNVRILPAAGPQVPPVQTYCTARSGMTVTVNAGASLPMTATFTQQAWAAGTFGLYWFGYSAGAMQLRSGAIVAVAPPVGSSLTDMRGSWAKIADRAGGLGLLLLVAVLVALGLWLRLWYVRSDRTQLPEPAEPPARAPSRRSPARRAPARQAQSGQAQSRQAQSRQAQSRQAPTRQDQSRQDQIRQDQIRQDRTRQPQARQAPTRRAAARQEPTRQAPTGRRAPIARDPLPPYLSEDSWRDALPPPSAPEPFLPREPFMPRETTRPGESTRPTEPARFRQPFLPPEPVRAPEPVRPREPAPAWESVPDWQSASGRQPGSDRQQEPGKEQASGWEQEPAWQRKLSWEQEPGWEQEPDWQPDGETDQSWPPEPVPPVLPSSPPRARPRTRNRLPAPGETGSNVIGFPKRGRRPPSDDVG